MPLTWGVELQCPWLKPMFAVARPLPIFALQNETNLSWLMRMFVQPKPGRYESFGNANPIELTPAQLLPETVRSLRGGHTPIIASSLGDAYTNLKATRVLDALRLGRELKFMRWKVILRGVAAMIIGYAVIVLLTIFGFNVVLGGRPLYGGSALVLGAGMLVAVLAGLTGGFIAGWIGAGRGLINAALVLLPLTIDTIGVLFFFKGSTAPMWFDAMASATLMFFTLLGGWLSDRTKPSPGFQV